MTVFRPGSRTPRRRRPGSVPAPAAAAGSAPSDAELQSWLRPVDADDVRNAYHLLTGRTSPPVEVLDGTIGLLRPQALERLMALPEFAAATVPGSKDPSLFLQRLPRASVLQPLLDWTAAFFGLPASVRRRLAPPLPRLDLLSFLFKAPALNERLVALLPPSLRETFVADLQAGAEAARWPQYFQDRYDLLQQSGAFDRDYYLDRNPDVAVHGVDPLQHYMQFGYLEGRDPSATFSTERYFWDHPEVARASADPLYDHVTRRTAIPEPVQADVPALVDRVVVPPAGDAWRVSFEARLAERVAALSSMDLSPPIVEPTPAAGAPSKRKGPKGGGPPPTFTVAMTVYDTDPIFLEALAASVSAQAFTDFEWIILDNGSRRADTIAMCRAIAARDGRVRLFRVEQNRHIIGGNRYVFERARGHYVVPIDSDDLLYPDALALFAQALRVPGPDRPAVLYSDEQKIDRHGEPIELIWRWGFSFARAMATVPAAHLMAFSRSRGEAAQVYTEDYARGSHDWDTTLRIMEAGGTAVHVPEVLYGWRMHQASTASATAAKDYILTSQIGVVLQSLARRGLAARFAASEMKVTGDGYYAVCRRPVDVPVLMIDIVVELPAFDPDGVVRAIGAAPPNAICRVLYQSSLSHVVEYVCNLDAGLPVQAWIAIDTAAELERRLNEVPEGVFAKAVVNSAARLADETCFIEALGVLELDVSAGIVGGPVLHGTTVLSAGLLAGLDDFVASPYSGWDRARVPQTAWYVRRPVTAFGLTALVIRADLLRAGLRLPVIDHRTMMGGVLLCLSATRMGYGSVYTPEMECALPQRPTVCGDLSRAERRRLRAEYAAELGRTVLSAHLTRRPECFGSLLSPVEQGLAPAFDPARLSPAIPLNLLSDPSLAAFPTVNLLLPAIRMQSMSGGPNTALNIAYRLARRGFAVRLMSTDVAIDGDLAPVWRHIIANGGGGPRPKQISIVDASDRNRPVRIGCNDIFFATAWWTAQMSHFARKQVRDRPFIYLIQDFEPILYPASSNYALSLETYGFDCIPVINTTLLRDYLVENRIGAFAIPGAAQAAITFQPAVSRDSFFPEPRDPHQAGPRTLLFYARPGVGIRNLFEVGVAALQLAIHQEAFDPRGWRFIGIGEQFAPMALGRGAVLECAPWFGFDEYAARMRGADLLLSLMMSPHPSYPPLEFAACGGLVVTNVYANKDATRLAAISPNIIAVKPTIAVVAAALGGAVARLDASPGRSQGLSRGVLPSTWDESFATLLPELERRLHGLGLVSETATWLPAGEPRRLEVPRAETPAYAQFLVEAAARRRFFNRAVQEPGLLSFVTCVWDTPPAFLQILADSLHDQVGGTAFEWLVLDNGSTRADTKALIARLALEPYVRVERVTRNLGIIGGMRYCLERASGRYLMPLDADDYLYPDCVQTITWYIKKHGYPALLYTDEDKLIEDRLFQPYQKPDWDPVLFVNSCYTSHLGVIDRELALALGLYTDPVTEGSHDWDAFTRFYNAGHVPVHVPEVLYSWRLHAGSTSFDINSKPVVYESQLGVLNRFLSAHPKAPLFELTNSPLFAGSPDWWFRRRRVDPPPMTTLLVRSSVDGGVVPDLKIGATIDHQLVELNLSDGIEVLAFHAARCLAEGRLVHVLASEVAPKDDLWYWEAVGLLELFPGTVAVGGRIHSHNVVLEAGRFLGVGTGCASPDRGRPLSDPGYFAQMWKTHSVGAVSAMHAVFEPGFLVDTVRAAAYHRPSIANLGNWVGGFARRHGRRVIYSPLIDAATTIDWDAVVTAEEVAAFNSVHIDLMPDRQLRSPHLACGAGTGYEPGVVRPFDPAGVPKPAYTAWLPRHVAARQAAVTAPRGAGAIAFAVLTTLYIGTDAALFRQTATSVLTQTHTNFEWVVLAHGPISAELDAVLYEIAGDRRVRLLRLERNLGIIGGMRHVLEAAAADYVVPMDGDDLLTPDCLALVAAAIVTAPSRPAWLYTDEDVIVGGAVQDPYVRPDWDPVLDLENSWIWHVGIYRRDLAVSLGAYLDRGSEFCHDWDTVYRFTSQGHRPVHVRAIAYHWRRHVGSTSNSAAPTGADPDHGSAASVRSLLQRKIDDRGLGAVASVAPYPIWRGAAEYCIARAPEGMPQLAAMTFIRAGRAAAVEIEGCDPVMIPQTGCVEALRLALDRLDDATIVLLTSDLVSGVNRDGALEAIKLFEFVDDVVAVSGHLVRGDVVVCAGLVCDESGRIGPGMEGRGAKDPGPYALHWKPHCVAAPAVELTYARAGFLRRVMAACPADTGLDALGLWIGAVAAREGALVASSPLITGTASAGWTGGFDALATPLIWREAVGARDAGAGPVRQGSAGYRLI